MLILKDGHYIDPQYEKLKEAGIPVLAVYTVDGYPDGSSSWDHIKEDNTPIGVAYSTQEGRPISRTTEGLANSDNNIISSKGYNKNHADVGKETDVLNDLLEYAENKLNMESSNQNEYQTQNPNGNSISKCNHNFVISRYGGLPESASSGSLYHSVIYKCDICGIETEGIEKHSFKNGVCTICEAQSEKQTADKCLNERVHKDNWQIFNKNATSNSHDVAVYCSECDAEWIDTHDKFTVEKYINVGVGEKHKVQKKCSICNEIFTISEYHSYKDNVCKCGQKENGTTVHATKISFNKSSISLKAGNNINLNDYLVLTPKNADVILEWKTSDDEAVQLTTSGKIKGIKVAKNITITVTDLKSGYDAKIKVTITGQDNNQSNKNTKKYTDVLDSAWYSSDVNKATEEGIFNGVTDTEFSPETHITRGMFITALARLDKDKTREYANIFDDVDNEVYYKESVAWAYANGIINGMDNYNFAPDKSISREEMAKIIDNYIIMKHYSVVDSLPAILNEEEYNDLSDISTWARASVYELTQLGLLKGKNNNNFAPKDNVTRAEAATILVRLFKTTLVKNDKV